MKFYFTFGISEMFPYQRTYLIVVATDIKDAIRAFRSKHPDVNEGCINCSDYYNESYWNKYVSKYYTSDPAEVIFSEQCFGKKEAGYDDVYVYVPEKRQIVFISEGTGDNLSSEDMDDGYVDYINYEVYSMDDGISEDDGGILLLKQLVKEKYTCLADCIPDVMEYIYECAYMNCKIL